MCLLNLPTMISSQRSPSVAGFAAEGTLLRMMEAFPRIRRREILDLAWLVRSVSSLPFAFDTSFSAVGCQPKRKSKSLREEGYPFAAKPVLGHDDELLRGDVETKFTVQGWGQAAARHQLVGGQKKPSLPHLAPHLAEQLSPSAVPGCSSQFPGSAPSGTSPKAILVLPLLQAFQKDD